MLYVCAECNRWNASCIESIKASKLCLQNPCPHGGVPVVESSVAARITDGGSSVPLLLPVLGAEQEEVPSRMLVFHVFRELSTDSATRKVKVKVHIVYSYVSIFLFTHTCARMDERTSK